MLSKIPDDEKQEYQQVLNILNYIVGGFSVLGGLWVYYFYFKVSEHRPFSLKLVLALSTADFIFSVANIIAAFDGHIDLLCYIEAGMREFSVIASLYFATSIGIWANYTFNRGIIYDQQKAFFIKTMIIGLIIPTIFTLMPIMLSNYYSYGHETYGCYIVLSFTERTSTDNLVLYLIFYGSAFIASFSTTLVAYTKIVRKWNKLSKDLELQYSDIAAYKLYFYPAVLFFSGVPSFIDDIMGIYFPSTYLIFGLNIMHITLSHSMGFSNAFVYGYLRRKNYQVKDEAVLNYQTLSEPSSLKSKSVKSFQE